MRNQQTYPLIPELREPRFRDRDRVQPAGDRDNRKAQDGQPFELHGCARYAAVKRERETGGVGGRESAANVASVASVAHWIRDDGGG